MVFRSIRTRPKLHSRYKKESFVGVRWSDVPAPTSFIPLLRHIRIVGQDDLFPLPGPTLHRHHPSVPKAVPDRAIMQGLLFRRSH